MNVNLFLVSKSVTGLCKLTHGPRNVLCANGSWSSEHPFGREIGHIPPSGVLNEKEGPN